MKCFPSIALLNFGAEARLFFYLPYARMTMPCSCRKWGNYLICLKKYIMRKILRFVCKNVISIDNVHTRSINCEHNNTLIAPIEGWCSDWQQRKFVTSLYTGLHTNKKENERAIRPFLPYKQLRKYEIYAKFYQKYTNLSGIKMHASVYRKNSHISRRNNKNRL